MLGFPSRDNETATPINSLIWPTGLPSLPFLLCRIYFKWLWKKCTFLLQPFKGNCFQMHERKCLTINKTWFWKGITFCLSWMTGICIFRFEKPYLFILKYLFHTLCINFASFNPTCSCNARTFFFRALSMMNIEAVTARRVWKGYWCMWNSCYAMIIHVFSNLSFVFLLAEGSLCSLQKLLLPLSGG